MKNKLPLIGGIVLGAAFVFFGTGKLSGQGSRLAGSNANRLTVAKHVAASMWSRAKARLRG